MNTYRPDHHGNEGSQSGNDQKVHHPFWKRAHRDWRTWCVAVLMILCMIYYVMSDDFALRFRGRPPQQESGAVRK